MPVDATARDQVESFRSALEATLSADERFEGPARVDREDGSTLATRFGLAPQLWLEVAVRPLIPQVRIGVLTDDRWCSEDLEQAIEDSGDTMSEFVEAGFDEVDLDWPEPPVEHYRDQGKYFYFATPLELSQMDELSQPEFRARIERACLGYYTAFETVIAKLNADDE